MKKFLILIIIIVVGIIYKVIFYPFPIAGGDYITLSKETINYFRSYPFQAWDSHSSFGFNNVAFIYTNPYSSLMGVVGMFLFDNNIVLERLFLWIPFLFLSFFSISSLYQYVFSKNFNQYFAFFLFTCNTYILMIIGGGQISGIGLGYAITPLVLLQFIKVINYLNLNKIISDKFKVQNSKVLRNSIIAGLLLSIQIMFDLRIAYITLFAVGMYFLFSIKYQVLSIKHGKKIIRNILYIILYTFLIPGVITILLHMFWILPLLLFKLNPIQNLGAGYSSIQAVNFFSFAKFENSISLLHPNWPENIFGLTHFMNPAFLVIPILAFASLLFIKKSKFVSRNSKKDSGHPSGILRTSARMTEKNNVTMKQCNNGIIIFFVALALLGAFLAKGTNDPFGGVYSWMFLHIPGFELFRDSTKWYLMVALSYSIIIPNSVEYIADWLTDYVTDKNTK